MDFESSYTPYLSEEKLKYLRLLAEKYPSIPAVCREIINLKAILNLPKGTEHFMSDLHGEYEAFYHILNNAAGVIKEKVDMIFGSRLIFLQAVHLKFLHHRFRQQVICAGETGDLYTGLLSCGEDQAVKGAECDYPVLVQNDPEESDGAGEAAFIQIYPFQGT